MSELLKVVVDRSLWFRGQGSDDSLLLNRNTGQMCCLGFAALAAGLKEKDIEDRSAPSDIEIVAPKKFEGLVQPSRYPDTQRYDNSDVCQTLMSTNDQQHTKFIDTEDDGFVGPVEDQFIYKDAEREAVIISVGKDAGFDFEFVN